MVLLIVYYCPEAPPFAWCLQYERFVRLQLERQPLLRAAAEVCCQ